jgi:hypothetical protein
MRTLGWGLIAALTLLAGASFAAAQPPKGKAMPDGWWNDLFGPSKPKPVDDPKKDPKAQPAPRPLTRAEREQQLARLEAALLRRQAVCHQLAEIADATNNAALAAEADRLNEMAFEAYKRQTRALGMAGYVAPEADAASEPYELPPPARERGGMMPSRMRSGRLDEGISEPSRSWGDDR